MSGIDLSDLFGNATVESTIPGHMNESELAALLMVAQSTIRTLARDGLAKRTGPGCYDVRATLAAYLPRLRDAASRSGRPPAGGPTSELAAEKLRLAKEQADKLELANQAARGELLPASEVEREWQNVLRDIRSTMLAVPSRVGSKLAHLSAHDLAEIDTEIKAALEGPGCTPGPVSP